jgi:hypothetical protein
LLDCFFAFVDFKFEKISPIFFSITISKDTHGPGTIMIFYILSHKLFYKELKDRYSYKLTIGGFAPNAPTGLRPGPTPP